MNNSSGVVVVKFSGVSFRENEMRQVLEKVTVDTSYEAFCS